MGPLALVGRCGRRLGRRPIAALASVVAGVCVAAGVCGSGGCEGFEKSPGLLDGLVTPAAPELVVVAMELPRGQDGEGGASAERLKAVAWRLGALGTDVAALGGVGERALSELLPAVRVGGGDARPGVAMLAVGAGTPDGRDRELAPILYRPDVFELVGTGAIESGPAGAEAGSGGRGLLAVWARLREGRTSRTLLVVNAPDPAPGLPPVGLQRLSELAEGLRRPGDRVVLCVGARSIVGEGSGLVAAPPGLADSFAAAADPGEPRSAAIVCSAELPVRSAGVVGLAPGPREGGGGVVWARIVLAATPRAPAAPVWP